MSFYKLPSNYNFELLIAFCALGVIVGHVYPLYYDFKGGKGAGTMVGILLSCFPISLIICFSFWIFILISTGYVGLSTIIAGIILPICTVLFFKGGLLSPFGIFTIFISLFILFTHRSNIKRMINGNENRFKKVMIFNRKSY